MPIDIDALRIRLAEAVGEALIVGDVLGVGASAAVFRGRDVMLERDVAIKVIDPALAPSNELVAMFLNEARLVASVEHPNIVPLYSAENRGGLLFLVMRLLEGRSLTAMLKERARLAPADAARVAGDVAGALAAAHARGVVHRDIKPDNVLLDASGRAYVTDFGIAHVMSQSPGASIGVTTGTPDYMSPEQLLGEEVDGRTDVYATGVLLYEMLAGAPPFTARTVAAIMARHMTQSPPSLNEVAPETPTALASIAMAALAKSREERPTAAALLEQLREAQTPQALRSPAQVRRAARRKRLLILGALVVTAITFFSFVALLLWRVLMLVYADGSEPVLNAFYTMVPDSLVQAARAEGALRASETAYYAYIPAGKTAADAMLVTDSVLVRRSARGAKRYAFTAAKMDVNRALSLFGTSTGVLTITEPTGVRDTLYTAVSGVEALRLGSAFAVLEADGKRRGR